MLWTPVNEFQSAVDNYGASVIDGSHGVEVIAAATAHTKGTVTPILGPIPTAAYGLAIVLSGGSASGTARNHLVDIRADPLGGSAYQTIIPNLLSSGPSLYLGGVAYYFPLYQPAGTSFAAASQSSVASAVIRVGLKIFGKPSRPDLVKTGAYVTAVGVTLATSVGTAVTPGTSVKSAYTELGTLAREHWWWQCGVGNSTGSMAANGVFVDLAGGDASQKVLVIRDLAVVTDGSERMGKEALGQHLPYKALAPGAILYASLSSSGAPVGTWSCIAYGLGG
jgi:hypothetical protein